MKDSTKDNADGTIHEIKGTVKEKIGQLTNDPDLEAEGTVEKVAGQIQQVVGKVKNVVGK